MAHVTGPVSTLPGSLHKVPAGTCCDEHEDREAMYRVQGETDSMGAEYVDLCSECYDPLKSADNKLAAATGRCDWCGLEKDTLRPRRDMDEGMCGPVYRVCLECVQAENDRYAEEYELNHGYDD